MYSIDATTIDLCLNLFPWAHFRKPKAGIKVSIKLDHCGKIPCFALISNANKHEVQELKHIPLQKGDIVVFDRGYTSYSYFANLCSRSIYFVTRLRSSTPYTVIKNINTGKNNDILSDEIIELDGFYAQKNCPYRLRKITSIDSKINKTIEILTNQFQWAASTIAAVYKDRWQVELFFKAIKQNLKIKRFYGTSENAVHTQIWIALICYLLFCILKNMTKAKRNFTCFVSVFPTVVFQRRFLFDWFSEIPPPPKIIFNTSAQLELI